MSKVKLVSITKPVIEGLSSAQDLISYCARVSNPSNQLNTETAPRLISYLIKHKHWSPLEMASACMEIKTSRAIAAQILRHKSFSFQEASQRYSAATSFEDIEFRKQGKTNRQVGDEVIDLSPELNEKVELAQKASLDAYNSLIENGIAKECARFVLPLNTSTTIYMNGTIRSWVHFIQIREKSDTQKEHREIAIAAKEILLKEFPDVFKALDETAA